MKVMPVVVLQIENQNIYLDPRKLAVQRNVFVALVHSTFDVDGSVRYEYQEFVPCEDVKNETWFIEDRYEEVYA